MTKLSDGFTLSLWDGGIGAQPPWFYSQWLLCYHSRAAELPLIQTAAVQITDGFTLAGHWGSVIVIELVLFGLSNELARQVEEKFLDVVGLFGRRLQVQHALSLSEIFSPLPENFSLVRQVDFIT